MTDSVLISIISGLTGVLVAYITTRYKRQKARPEAKDRIDTAFEWYERLIKQQQAELDRKEDAIMKLRAEVDTLKAAK